MTKISAQDFFSAWVRVVQARKERLTEIWRNRPGFTSEVKGGESSVLAELGKQLELNCYQSDYYHLDSIFYSDSDLVPSRPAGTFWFRDMRIAFEHENDYNSGLYKEVSHLLLLNCDLRVLVTYPNDDGNSQLDILHSIIEGNRRSQQFSEEESFLIIYGYENGFGWEGHIYKQKGWKEIQSDLVSINEFTSTP